MSSTVTRVTLPDGTHVWARVSDAEQPATGAPDGGRSSRLGYADTGLADRAAAGALAQVESLRTLITGVAASVAEGLRSARPDEVTVTFGIELTARAGKVVGLLADGETKGAITVSLTWQGAPPADLGRAEGAGGDAGRAGGGHGPL